jgi:hypothetical protein
MVKPGGAAPKPAGVTETSSSARLSEITLASVTALAGTGEIETACRLAGQAYAALRSADPAAARRFDVLLHRLTPKLKG